MSDLLKKGIDSLNSCLKSHASQTVTYKRGANNTTLLATMGETGMEIGDGYGSVIKAKVVDFTLSVADLMINDSLISPDEGDKIIYDGKTYEVLDLGGQGCCRHSDGFGTRWRIHTKLISS